MLLGALAWIAARHLTADELARITSYNVCYTKLLRGLEVVVEGVELESHTKRLRGLSCDYAQGFFFGAPLASSDVPNFIAMTYSRES